MTFYMRKRFGLLWTTARPSIPWRDISIVIACILVYGLVAKIDELGERAIQMERAGAQHVAYKEALLACMSGASGFYFPDTQQAFECRVEAL